MAVPGVSEPVLMRGERVTVRPFRMEELEPLVASMAELTSAWRPTRAVLRERIARGGRMVSGELDLAIEAEGRLVGDVQARHFPHGHPPGVFLIGIALFETVDRGRGFGREAVELMNRHLFEAEKAERVEISTDVDNAAMRTVCERLGFTFEGVLRAYMPGPDGRRDYAMYGMTRADFETSENNQTNMIR